MAPFKTLWIATAASLTLHAAVVLSLGAPWSVRNHPEGVRSITLSYAQNTSIDPPQANIPYMKSKLAVTAPKRVSLVIPSKIEEKPSARWVALSSPDAVPPQPVRESAELLLDPVKGKVFTRYFRKIKDRLEATVRQKVPASFAGREEVNVLFVLNSEGILEKVSVAEKEKIVSSNARDFAIQCVKESAPFPSFPKDLGLKKIVFTITLVFGDL